VARGRPKKTVEELGLAVSDTETATNFEMGKLYLNIKDVWSIDSLHGDFVQVRCRTEVFKVKPAQLVLFDNGGEAAEV
jgi:hypothetical protein